LEAKKDLQLEMTKTTLSKNSSLINEIEKALNLKLICFICHQSITNRVAYRLNKIIRKMSGVETLGLLIDSGGGDIDATSKIVKLLRANCKKFVAIVPFWAKSAATLLAVSADELILCKSAELGLVDPQVRDPVTGMWVPAHSIKEALKFIEEDTKEPLVKLSMAEKLPPLLMGAYRGAQNVSRQYMEEAFEKLGDKKDEALHIFTDKYLSHGYPIDRQICKEINLPVVFPDNDLENKISELHENYIDLLIGLGHKAEEEEEAEKIKENLIIQTSSAACVIIHGEDISSQL
jgi:ATP-dependent protease ClpP protease subunit